MTDIYNISIRCDSVNQIEQRNIRAVELYYIISSI